MSRTLKFKLGYVIGILLLGGAVVLASFWLFPDNLPLGLVIFVVVLFVPGRVQGLFYRDLFRGRRLVDAGAYEEAMACFDRFLTQIRQKPWQKHLVWLAGVVYSPDIEAMALNNIGTAHARMGHWQEAKGYFRDALALDPKYPLPHFNLAIVAAANEEEGLAEEHLARAQALGYRRTLVDQVIHQAQALLAHIEGRGATKAEEK